MRISSLLPFLALAAAIFAEEPWIRSLEKAGIVIETRKVSGSDYKEFRATMRVNASLQKSLAVMQDFNGYKSWMKDCKESRRLVELSPSSGIVYSLQSTPWPISEREAVVRYSYQKTAKPATALIWLAAAPDALPPTPGKVRIAKLKGYWRFRELDAGHTEVIYSMHSEPGGSLPGWAAAGMVAHLPFETLKKLREVLER
ncbi:START domain-containing protein [Turneriella parva]|nr:START domain-containing protein [Turneriella parva]